MKTEHVEKFPELYKGFAFLSHYCSKCGCDVTLEKMWRALISKRWDYLCTYCAPTEKEAHKYYINGEYRPERRPPKFIPPQPEKREIK